MPNGLPTMNTWLPSFGASSADRIGATERGETRRRVNPVSRSAATHCATWPRPWKSRATIGTGFFPAPGPDRAGGGSIRIETISPPLLITTPVATRRVPAGASAAVYSSATTDSRARAIAWPIRRSSRPHAASNSSTFESLPAPPWPSPSPSTDRLLAALRPAASPRDEAEGCRPDGSFVSRSPSATATPARAGRPAGPRPDWPIRTQSRPAATAPHASNGAILIASRAAGDFVSGRWREGRNMVSK